MKIIKGMSNFLILSGCEIAKNYRNDETCLVKFYSASGAFNNSHTIIEVRCTYEKIHDFLLGDDKFLECGFSEYRHQE